MLEFVLKPWHLMVLFLACGSRKLIPRTLTVHCEKKCLTWIHSASIGPEKEARCPGSAGIGQSPNLSSDYSRS
jgi:hypothetical protein